MRSSLAALALLLPVLAFAVPQSLQHTGRLVDSAGLPLDGTHVLTLSLYDQASGGNVLWTGDLPAQVEEGYFAVALGDAANPIADAAWESAELWLGIAVDAGPELSPRQRVHSVPFAVRAQGATNVHGGVVDASEIRVNGQIVVDGSGAVVGPVSWNELLDVPDDLSDGEDADTVGSLGCSSGQIAVFDGLDWACGAASPTDLSADVITSGTINVARLPVGSSDGTVAAGVHAHDAGDVTTGTFAIGRLPIGTGTGNVAAGDHTHAISEITGDLPMSRVTGDLPIARVTGDVPMSRVTGDLPIARVTGDVPMSRVTGDLPIARVTGDVPMSRVTGNLAATRLTGEVPVANLPVGTSAAQVAAGNHTHSAADISGGTLAGVTVKLADVTTTCNASSTTLHGAVRFQNGAFEGCTDAGWVLLGKAAADGSSSADAGITCKSLKSENPTLGNGLYWIDPDGLGGASAWQTYCDMTTDGGGWTLVGYSYAGSTTTSTSNHAMRSLKCGGGSFSPASRGAAAASVAALPVARQSTEVAFSMSTGGAAVSNGGLNAYTFAYKFAIPNPGALTFDSQSYLGGNWNSTAGACVPVAVSAIHGVTWSATHYTKANSLGVSWTDSYPTGYGAGNTSNCLQDYTNGPFITSIHTSHGHSNGSGQGPINECDVPDGATQYTHRGNYTHNSVNTTGSAAIWFR